MSNKEQGWSFHELWVASQKFRRIFYHRGVISKKNQDSLAEFYWADRHPRTEWALCGIDGCMELVHIGEVCSDHALSEEELPNWNWAKGHLYKRVAVYESKSKILREHKRMEFKRYDTHAWKNSFGALPEGFVVRYIDQNPFNLRPSNLIAISKIAAAALDAGVINVREAITMDNALPDDVLGMVSSGRPEKRWIYSIQKIACYLGVQGSAIRRAISKGTLDPESFSAVIDYCAYSGDGPKKKWTYSYQDIARAAEVHVNSVRQAANRGTFDPSSVESVMGYCLDSKKGGRKAATWQYTVKEIADLTGLLPPRVWDAINRGSLDPSDLASVLAFCNGHTEKKDVKKGQHG
jgi:hypothetical protein